MEAKDIYDESGQMDIKKLDLFLASDPPPSKPLTWDELAEEYKPKKKRQEKPEDQLALPW